MIELRSGQKNLYKKENNKTIKELLKVLLVFLVLWLISYGLFVIIHKPEKEVVLGIEMEEKYAPRFEPYANFDFQEEGQLFKLTITDQDTFDEINYFIEDGFSISEDYGWDVIVQNMVVLSTEIEKETGKTYDFLVMDPEDQTQVFLLIEDSEISYNKFPLQE